MRGPITSAHELSNQELRLVGWLPTRLPFAAIDERLGVPQGTAKATAIALYRRLGVIRREEAVRRCTQLGLLESEDPTPEPDDDIRLSLEALDEAFFHMRSVRDDSQRIIDFEYRYCNAAALAVLGRSRDEVIGRRLLELFPSHQSVGLFDAYVQVTESGKPLRYEFAFDEDGVVGEFEVVVCRLGDGYVLAGHDISKRKQQERHLVLVKDQLQTALASRVLIEQAKGYAAAKSGTDPETAFHLMRQHARQHNRGIDDVARSILNGRTELG